MQRLTIAIRAACLVAGIVVFATLANRLIADSDIKLWLLMRQQSLPGSLLMVQIVESCAYGLAALALAWVIASGYWRQLFPARANWLLLGLCLGAGVLFAMFFNHPMHVALFEVFFGKPTFTGGAIADSIAAGIFSGLQGWSRIFTVSAFATVILTPFIEELTDRGILFKEADALPLWQVAILSFLVFCMSHYAIGGMAKVLAVVPASILFVLIRLRTGSFLYSAVAHVGVNAAALLKLQVF